MFVKFPKNGRDGYVIKISGCTGCYLSYFYNFVACFMC